MLQYFLKRSLHSLAVCVCCFLFNMIPLAPFEKAYAQNDNSRWYNVKAWKGTFSLTGTYQGSANGYDEITIQNSVSGSVAGYNMGNLIHVIGSYSMYEKYVQHGREDCDNDGNNTDDLELIRK